MTIQPGQQLFWLNRLWTYGMHPIRTTRSLQPHAQSALQPQVVSLNHVLLYVVLMGNRARSSC